MEDAAAGLSRGLDSSASLHRGRRGALASFISFGLPLKVFPPRRPGYWEEEGADDGRAGTEATFSGGILFGFSATGGGPEADLTGYQVGHMAFLHRRSQHIVLGLPEISRYFILNIFA